MRTAYLGIADHGRLLAWWPEQPESYRFLRRRQARRTGEVCFWAVLPDQDARRVADCLEVGELADALRLLQEAEPDIGSILPSDSKAAPCSMSQEAH